MLYIRTATIEKINKRIKRINKIKIITFFIVVLLYFLYDYIRMFLKMKGFSMGNDVFFDSFLRSLRFHFRDKCKDIGFIEFFKCFGIFCNIVKYFESGEDCVYLWNYL